MFKPRFQVGDHVWVCERGQWFWMYVVAPRRWGRYRTSFSPPGACGNQFTTWGWALDKCQGGESR